jgi:hypothetical protein
MRADRAPYKILQFNDFGLVAITRKRVKQSLERTLCAPCPYCEGAGYVKSVQTMMGEILQEANKIARSVDGKDVMLRVAPDVAKLLKSNQNTYLQELEEVLGKPTVVELKDIQNDEEKAFVAALLLSNIASYAQARGLSKHLRHFTLIEEAHRLLPNVSTEKGDPEAADPRRRTVEQFGNMLAEPRAYGEGLAVVEQIPTKILPDAIKNTTTKVVHRVPALDDRRVMAGAMNATKEQAAVFTALKPGEAVLGIEGHPVPVRVEVDDVVARLGVPVGEVTDDNVRERMTGFYLRNPLPKTVPLVEDPLRELVGSERFGKELQEAYRLWIKTGRIGSLEGLVLRSAERFASTKDDQVKEAVRILSLGTALHLPLDEEDRALLPRVVERDIRRSMRDGRAS